MTLLPVASAEEIKNRRMKLLSVDFTKTRINEIEDILKRPLQYYDDGSRDLSEMVWKKWQDADNQALDDYNTQISETFKNTKDQNNHFLRKMRSDKIGHLAHEYLMQRQKISDDLSRQSSLASLQVRRLNKSMPRLNKASQIVRNMFFIAGLATSVLAVDQGKTPAIQGCMTLTCLSVVAASVLTIEKRRVERQSLYIKKGLFDWHQMNSHHKNAFYDKVMKPSHMGLCGFVETFYRT